MEKRTLIAFVLALLIIIYYPHYLQKIYPSRQEKPENTVLAERETPVLPSVEEKNTAPVITSPDIPESTVKLSTPLMEITFSNYGGTIKSLNLLKYLDKEGQPVGLVLPASVNYRPFSTSLPKAHAAYSLEKGKGTVVCRASSGSLNITKIYSVTPDSYLIRMRLLLENTGNRKIILPNLEVGTGAVFPGEETRANMYMGAVVLADGRALKARLGRTGFRKLFTGKIFWAGVKNKYFSLILKPGTTFDTAEVTDCENTEKRGICGRIAMRQLIVPPGGGTEESFLLYAGPKKYKILKSLGAGLDGIMDFGMLAPISKLVLHILNFFYGVVHNYGIAIILLTLLVKIVLYPLTLKSYKSMREMHKLQPLMQELQKKYKGDPKRMQKETMLLYKEHKVNPFSGCFPMLLQMPVLIAFFTTLRSAIELRGAPFMLWIKDLSEPDTLLRLQNGFPLNVLPLFLIGAMFLQQKMTAMPAASEQQKQQQKIMSKIMPVFLGFIFYNMPSGLVLYFGLSTILGVLDQYRIEKAKLKNN